MTELLLGGWKRPMPAPSAASRAARDGSESPAPAAARDPSPAASTAAPARQRTREPKRSESQPATGEVTDRASGTAVSMSPSRPPSSPFTCER